MTPDAAWSDVFRANHARIVLLVNHTIECAKGQYCIYRHAGPVVAEAGSSLTESRLMCTMLPSSGLANVSCRSLLTCAKPFCRVGLGHAAAIHAQGTPATVSMVQLAHLGVVASIYRQCMS